MMTDRATAGPEASLLGQSRSGMKISEVTERDGGNTHDRASSGGRGPSDRIGQYGADNGWARQLLLRTFLNQVHPMVWAGRIGSSMHDGF
jgi:hypothetical protein